MNEPPRYYRVIITVLHVESGRDKDAENGMWVLVPSWHPGKSFFVHRSAFPELLWNQCVVRGPYEDLYLVGHVTIRIPYTETPDCRHLEMAPSMPDLREEIIAEQEKKL